MVNFKHLFDNGKVVYFSNCYGNNDLEIVDKTEEGEQRQGRREKHKKHV